MYFAIAQMSFIVHNTYTNHLTVDQQFNEYTLVITLNMKVYILH